MHTLVEVFQAGYKSGRTDLTCIRQQIMPETANVSICLRLHNANPNKTIHISWQELVLSNKSTRRPNV